MIRKILKITLMSIGIVAVNGCGGDNAHDGTGLGAGDSSQGNALSSLQQNVFVAHSVALQQSVDALVAQTNALTATVTDADVQKLRENFVNTSREWKSVQATYIAGDYDSSLIDTPQFIDFYHTGKRLDIPADIDNALNQGGSIEAALFKNSSKSINALEYLVFGHKESNAAIANKMNINNKRRVEALKVVTTNLKNRIAPIVSFYQSNKAFASDEKDASNAIVNALIDSAFKLKEWRVGEPAGISIKFKDRPDPSRFEYYRSTLSTEGIKAIVSTHQDVMSSKSYANFGSFASEKGAGSIVASIEAQLNAIMSIVNSFNSPIETTVTTNSVDERVVNLYNAIKTLQGLYFESLIQALDLTAEIIEADGD